MKLSKSEKSKRLTGDTNFFLQNIKAQEKLQKSFLLLNILYMSYKNIDKTKAKGIKETFSDIRNELGITG
ncbi:MAG: hypothetical protein ABR980_03275 [Ignavibacteriaceae bacterium]|jgi:hypothetical protein